jgi:hypothetical protein
MEKLQVKKKKRGDAIAENPRAARLREQVRKWHSKNGPEQLPDAIWKAALDLTQEYSVRSIVRYVGLKSWTLHERLKAQAPTKMALAQADREQWLELPAPVPVPRPSVRPPTGLWLEWRSPVGARLRVRYQQGQQQLLREALEVLK